VFAAFVVGYFELAGAAVIGGLENFLQSDITSNHWNLPLSRVSPDDRFPDDLEGRSPIAGWALDCQCSHNTKRRVRIGQY
jgi:hypothetical protein